MLYFASQIRGEQDTIHSLRARRYRNQRKAKLDDDDEEAESSANPDSGAETRSSSRARSSASFASSEIAQLRVAGLLPDDEHQIPPLPFPHAPARVAKGRYGASQVEEEMATSPSRLYVANATSKNGSLEGRKDTNALKRTHLQVLSTVMHRCLLDADYERAGRAWGMILRTQVAGGYPVDPRNQARWGIGAEILLHRTHQSLTGQNEHPQNGLPNTHTGMFSDQGFELAREYYERLIVQHPNRRTHPHTVDERSFYPAMFSLWIFEICERSKRARQKVQDEAASTRSSRDMSIDGVLGDAGHDSRAEQDAIDIEELARAMEIAERLDQLIVSPPFDKEASLFQLRGHIALWISDLIIGSHESDEHWDMDPVFRDGEDDREDDGESATEKLTRLTSCHRQLQQATSFLQRAAAKGAHGQAATLSSIEFKLKELARQLEKLRAPQ